MKDMPKISAAEWEVMKLLWKESPLTSEKIINSLTEKNGLVNTNCKDIYN